MAIAGRTPMDRVPGPDERKGVRLSDPAPDHRAMV